MCSVSSREEYFLCRDKCVAYHLEKPSYEVLDNATTFESSPRMFNYVVLRGMSLTPLFEKVSALPNRLL